MNREEKIKELESTLDKCIKDLEALKQVEFKDGDKVLVKDSVDENWCPRIFKKYENGIYYTYNEETSFSMWDYCKPFK